MSDDSNNIVDMYLTLVMYHMIIHVSDDIDNIFEDICMVGLYVMLYSRDQYVSLTLLLTVLKNYETNTNSTLHLPARLID